MKIATVSDNGSTLSQHFGRAPYYVVVTVENGKIVGKETRERGSGICACGHEAHSHGSHQHSAESAGKHQAMADAIADCQVLIAGGMGWGAYQSLKNRKLEPIITDVSGIDEAVNLYLQGKIVNLMEKLH